MSKYGYKTVLLELSDDECKTLGLTDENSTEEDVNLTIHNMIQKQQTKTGHWDVSHPDYACICSECHSGIPKNKEMSIAPKMFNRLILKFCPFCGIPMDETTGMTEIQELLIASGIIEPIDIKDDPVLSLFQINDMAFAASCKPVTPYDHNMANIEYSYRGRHFYLIQSVANGHCYIHDKK